MTITNIDTRRSIHQQNAASGAIKSSYHTANDLEARGFALYIGVDEATVAKAGLSLADVARTLRETLGNLVPEAASHATVALAPRTATSTVNSNVEIVRLALKDPSLITGPSLGESNRNRARGVVVDFTRNEVKVDGSPVALTYTELRIIQHLVRNEGETVSRTELADLLWAADQPTDIGSVEPNLRTIDVHVRRLRAKLGDYDHVVRTVHGIGYRFDQHADVEVRAVA